MADLSKIERKNVPRSQLVNLFYDKRDDILHEARGSQILYWLDDLNAKPLNEARPNDKGFIFTAARPIDDYRQLVKGLPLLHDRPEERAPLLRLDAVLDALDTAGIEIPTPKTWKLPLDSELPEDIAYPLFVQPCGSPLPHHRAYGSVPGGSVGLSGQRIL